MIRYWLFVKLTLYCLCVLYDNTLSDTANVLTILSVCEKSLDFVLYMLCYSFFRDMQDFSLTSNKGVSEN